jgi:dihydrofolate synthase/folylpolyglutamate synthase
LETIKSYNKAIEYIFSLRRPREDYTPARNASHSDAGGPGIHLQRLKEFLEFVGNPQFDYPVIHIGGTSGKGSVTYITSKILREHGMKVGTHTSPYLINLNEKFQINFESISNSDFVELTKWLKSNLETFEKGKKIKLSYYESIIAMIFKYFSINKVDVAVIEVGMGGKYDGTNVVNSQIAILTNVGLDHMEFLGDTKEKILKDKVEIMKPNKTFITGVQEKNLQEIIIEKSIEKRNHLLIYNRDFGAKNISVNPEYSTFDFQSVGIEIQNIRLSLNGIYQIENACLAIQATIKYLQNKLVIDKLKNALGTASFAGRMEIYSKKPLIIIDGAHNESKMRALAQSMNTIYPNQKVKLLFSVKKGKDIDLILKELVKINIKEIIITEFKWEYYDTLESIKAEELKKELRKYYKDIKINIIENAYTAFKEASKQIASDELLLITGSLYLIGTLFQTLKAKN